MFARIFSFWKSAPSGQKPAEVQQQPVFSAFEEHPPETKVAVAYSRDSNDQARMAAYCEDHNLTLVRFVTEEKPSTEALSHLMNAVIAGDAIDIVIMRFADLDCKPKHLMEAEEDCLLGDAQLILIDDQDRSRQPDYTLTRATLDWGVQCRRWALQHSMAELGPSASKCLEIRGGRITTPVGFAQFLSSNDDLYLLRKGMHREVATVRLKINEYMDPLNDSQWPDYLEAVGASNVFENRLTPPACRRLRFENAAGVLFWEVWMPQLFFQGAVSQGLSPRRSRQAELLMQDVFASCEPVG